MRLPDLELKETRLTYPLLPVVESPERRGGIQWEQEVDHIHVAQSRDVSTTAQHSPDHVFIPADLRCPVWLAVHLLLD